MFKSLDLSEDPHEHVVNREFNWHNEGRTYVYPDNNNFFTYLLFSYLPLVFLGQLIMKNRNPMNVKWYLFSWNLLMSIISGIGAYNVLPWLYNTIKIEGIHYSICNHGHAFTSKEAWYIAIFNATKFLEWIDTLFLVIRKKNVGFLHWFHHIITFAYCWHASIYSYGADATGIWFAGMNLFVHFVMYGYYALTTLGFRSKYSFLITILQTLQMIVGVCVLCVTPSCKDSWKNNTIGNLFATFMYSCYLYLFSKLVLAKTKSKKE
jgi:hypothetical protein